MEVKGLNVPNIQTGWTEKFNELIKLCIKDINSFHIGET